MRYITRSFARLALASFMMLGMIVGMPLTALARTLALSGLSVAPCDWVSVSVTVPAPAFDSAMRFREELMGMGSAKADAPHASAMGARSIARCFDFI